MEKSLLVTALSLLSIVFVFAENVEQMKDSSDKVISITPNFIEIDVEAYKNNLNFVKKMIGNDVKLCAVMKADAYGHGIKNLISTTVISSAVDCIAGVDNSEFEIIAPAIIESGRDIAMLRIAPVTKSELVQSINNGWKVQEVIGSYEQAKMISDTAVEMSKILGKKIIIDVSINIETAMGRMAFRDVNDIKKAMGLPNLKIVGVMTHFAKDEDDDEDGVSKPATRKQLDIYEQIVDQLDLPKNVVQHVANGAAASKYPWTRKDMVRVGSLIYGEDVNDSLDPKHELKPVMKSYRSEIAIIERNIPPHTPINYDAEEYTRDNQVSTTATLRVGYSYGYPKKAYKEKAEVIINGHKYPIIGKSSMNMVVVDITDKPKNGIVNIGDQAIIVGKQGDEYITWKHFAEMNDMSITEQILNIGNLNKKLVV